MAVHLTCSQCRRRLAVSSRKSGTTIACPLCAAPLTVPAAATAICLREDPALPPAPKALAAPKPEVKPKAKAIEAVPAMNYRLIGASAAAALVFVVGLTVVCLAMTHRSRPAQPVAAAVAGLADAEHEVGNLDEAPEFVANESEPDLLPLTRAPVGEMEYVPPAPLVVKRRDKLNDEDLRRLLLSVRELNLDEERQRKTTRTILDMARKPKEGQEFHFTPDLLAVRGDLAGLPWRRGADCQLGKEPAESLQNVSRKIRDSMGRVQNRPNDELATSVKNTLHMGPGQVVIRPNTKNNFKDVTIPAAMQMLMVENRPVRRVLVEHLGTVGESTASEALARIALFDLSEQIRADALEVLSRRSPDEYRQVLLDGLRYPWAPVADHAAEALVVLKDKEALPALRRLSLEPDPVAPFYDNEQRSYVVRELVRVNHLTNCLMCHAPSRGTTEMVRGRIPVPDQPLPPISQYYESNDGIFVRADVTYLRQDFSVQQPVENANPWPTQQRFDYLVRLRPIGTNEFLKLSRLEPKETYPQREAVLHAIKELSGKGASANRGVPASADIGLENESPSDKR
ncbi:MAG: HEAT repeat domain-containing protein [Gemmataceae bacterium]|nr:HEAT repeat domain-containing protein [Gemmataceae bacterium]